MVWINDGESGASVRTKLNTIPNDGTSCTALLQTIAVTTDNAAPTDVDPASFTSRNVLINVTSDGSGLPQTLNLLMPALNADDINASFDGTQVTVFLETQAGSSDELNVTVDGSGFSFVNDVGQFIGSAATAVLDSQSASFVFIWWDYAWHGYANGRNSSTTITDKAVVLIGPADFESGYIARYGAGSHAATFDGDPGARTYQYVELENPPGPSSDLSPNFRQSYIETDGSGSVNDVTFSSSSVDFVGFNHVFLLAALTDPGDSVRIAVTNIKNSDGSDFTSLILANVNDWLLVECWDGSIWRAVRASAGVCTPAIAALGGVIAVDITTSGTPTDFDPVDGNVVAVTTGGTMGAEVLNVLDFATPIGGSNPPKNGTRLIVYLAVRSDAADRLRVTPSNTILAVNPQSAVDRGGAFTPYIQLGSVGESAEFVWQDYAWYWDNTAGNNSAAVQAWGKASAADTNQRIPITISGAPQWVGDLGVNGSYEYLETGAAPVAASTSFHQSFIESGATAGAESITFAAPPFTDVIGGQKLFNFGEKNDPGDSISIETANIQNADGGTMTSLTLTNQGDFLLVVAVSLTKWQIVAASPGVCNPVIALVSGAYAAADFASKTFTFTNGALTGVA